MLATPIIFLKNPLHPREEKNSNTSLLCPWQSSLKTEASPGKVLLFLVFKPGESMGEQSGMNDDPLKRYGHILTPRTCEC